MKHTRRTWTEAVCDTKQARENFAKLDWRDDGKTHESSEGVLGSQERRTCDCGKDTPEERCCCCS